MAVKNPNERIHTSRVGQDDVKSEDYDKRVASFGDTFRAVSEHMSFCETRDDDEREGCDIRVASFDDTHKSNKTDKPSFSHHEFGKVSPTRWAHFNRSKFQQDGAEIAPMAKKHDMCRNFIDPVMIRKASIHDSLNEDVRNGLYKVDDSAKASKYQQTELEDKIMMFRNDEIDDTELMKDGVPQIPTSITEGTTQSEEVVTPAKQNGMNKTSMMGTSVTMKIPQLDTADSDQWSGTLSLPDGDHSRVKFRPTHSHK